MTSALDVVPFGVDTSIVCNQSGAPGGTRFWKNDLPSAPSGNLCSIVGRPPVGTQDRLGDREVVADEIEFGRPEAREEDLVGMRDVDAAAGNLDALAGGSAVWARHLDRVPARESVRSRRRVLAGCRTVRR